MARAFGFNRTIVELKYMKTTDQTKANKGFNRTIVELKFYNRRCFIRNYECFNRTIVELKLMPNDYLFKNIPEF